MRLKLPMQAPSANRLLESRLPTGPDPNHSVAFRNKWRAFHRHETTLSQKAGGHMKTNRTNNGGAGLVQGCSDDGPIIQSESWLMPHRNLNIHRIVVPVDFSQTSRK